MPDFSLKFETASFEALDQLALLARQDYNLGGTGNLEFEKRVKGGHHMFRRAGVEDKINLQRDGNNAKPYQVRQVRAVLLKYKLGEVE